MKKGLQPRAATSQQPARAVDSPYLTAHETVIYLRLGSLSALYRLIKEHGLPHGRIGKLHRFDKRELDAFVKGFDSALERMRSRHAS